MLPRRRVWWFVLLVVTAITLISQQVFVAIPSQAQNAESLPLTKTPVWPSPTLIQEVFSNAQSMCEYTASQLSDSLLGIELLYTDNRKVYAATCNLETIGKSSAGFVYCPPDYYYGYVGGIYGVCLLGASFYPLEGALELAINSLIVSVPTSNGGTEAVSVEVNEKGQFIDPLTGNIATPIDSSTIGDTEGTQLLDKILQAIKSDIKNLTGFKPYSKEALAFSIAAINQYGNISSYTKGKIPTNSLGLTSEIMLSIASGILTGKYPFFLEDLNGFGVAPFFDLVNNAIKAVNDSLPTP